MGTVSGTLIERISDNEALKYLEVTGLEQQMPIETYKIDLDLPPKRRFVEPTRRFAKEVMALVQFYENYVIKNRITDQFTAAIDQAIYLNQRERYLELEGIAETLGIPTPRLITANFAYEFVAYCTSIIAK